MLEQFKNSVKNIINDHFDSLPIQINIKFNNGVYIVNIDVMDGECIKFDKNKKCIYGEQLLTDDLLFLCQKYIDQFNKDNLLLTEDGEGSGVAECNCDDTITNISVSDTTIDNPEINSTTVGGLYVTYVCPGALPYFKFYKRKNKKQ